MGSLVDNLASRGLLGLASSLPDGAALPVWIERIRGDDGCGVSYAFDVYDIRSNPAGFGAVYAFARREGPNYVPLYIGRAEFLSERLRGHERRDDAERLGARFVLVHIPEPFDLVPSFEEVERRLIRRYSPPLNVQHNNRD